MLDLGQPFFSFFLTRDVPDARLELIPKRDVSRLSILSKEIVSLLAVFGDRASDVLLEKNELRVYIEQNPGDPLPGIDTHELLQRTARELRENANRPSPLPHPVALSSEVIVPLLQVIAKNHRAGDLVPTYTNSHGTHDVPVLPTSVFVQSAPITPSSMVGKFEVISVTYDRNHELRVGLTHNRLSVGVPPEIQLELEELQIASLRLGLWIDGTLCQADDGKWTVRSGHLIVQEYLLPDNTG